MKIKPEILAPAGDYDKLVAAINYGADAVYLGGEEFSMRVACSNFSDEELKRAIDFAKSRNKKIYIATNVIMKNPDIENVVEFAKKIHSYGADAIILSDIGAFDVIKENAPKLDIHISTQANTNNYASANMWHRLGATRVVLSREMTYAEVKELRKRTSPDLELELFVHGAMCVSYSGRCLLSSFMTGREANRGACAQPCRWKYYLMEEKRPGEYMPVFEGDNGSYFFNSKDLCLIEFIPELVDAGITSFKIEGRVKSEYYVANTVKAYRNEVDRYFDNPERYVFDKKQLAELSKVSHRVYSYGFWHGAPTDNGQIYDSSAYIRDYEVVGVVKECDDDGNAVVEQKNKFSVGEKIEIMQPVNDTIEFVLSEMTDEKDRPIESAPHGKMTVKIKMPQKVDVNSMLRKEKNVD